MYYLGVFLGSILFCLGIVRLLGRPFFNLATSATRQLDVLLDRDIDEKQKDLLILSNLANLLKWLAINLSGLLLLVFMAALPAYGILRFQEKHTADLSSLLFVMSMVAGSSVLLFLRKKGDYGYWVRLLHVLVMDHVNLGRFLFERETRNLKGTSTEKEKDFVIISGLARSGTTALTHLLYHERVFHSPHYANMPFLLAPNLWNRLYHPRNSKTRERAHGDQVLFGQQTVEAFEEYFFKVFLRNGYIKEERLEKHEVEADILEQYYAFQELYRKREGTLYLAKNNNFLLRYESLRQHNHAFKCVLLFREPIAHAHSLLRQHQNFLTQQAADPFVLRYMDWLGHHEFGQNEKRFELGGEQDGKAYAKDRLSYWLAIWVNYYSYIRSLPPDVHLYLIHYEDLLLHPKALKKALGKTWGIRFPQKHVPPFTPTLYPLNSKGEIEDGLVEKALNIYQELCLRKWKFEKA